MVLVILTTASLTEEDYLAFSIMGLGNLLCYYYYYLGDEKEADNCPKFGRKSEQEGSLPSLLNLSLYIY